MSVVMLAGEGVATDVMYHALAETFNVSQVIVEERESASIFLKRRLRMLGLRRVIGQLLFRMITQKYLQSISVKRIEKILQSYQSAAIPQEKIKRVSSINSEECIARLKELNPSVVVVSGTRIISQKVLNAINCPIINTHAGITPAYRGVHGAYWALTQNDREHCGVTVHLVDRGVDTGQVLYQAIISPLPEDNFMTYPSLQLVAGVPLLKQAVTDALENNLRPMRVELKSQQWFHPTLGEYLFYRCFKGVR